MEAWTPNSCQFESNDTLVCLENHTFATKLIWKVNNKNIPKEILFTWMWTRFISLGERPSSELM